ncbi:hypothetical protein VP01_2192g2 [Puccinia sorghi]|uniref:Uncharacterized protein n=1 Tax=Puccinia sorghi TaxID=27349 RepID=A0A0L6VAX3_9BASI|nr:hypothetical protein VP01_2192g2 [Puccinia sorghi]
MALARQVPKIVPWCTLQMKYLIHKMVPRLLEYIIQVLIGIPFSLMVGDILLVKIYNRLYETLFENARLIFPISITRTEQHFIMKPIRLPSKFFYPLGQILQANPETDNPSNLNLSGQKLKFEMWNLAKNIQASDSIAFGEKGRKLLLFILNLQAVVKFLNFFNRSSPKNQLNIFPSKTVVFSESQFIEIFSALCMKIWQKLLSATLLLCIKVQENEYKAGDNTFKSKYLIYILGRAAGKHLIRNKGRIKWGSLRYLPSILVMCKIVGEYAEAFRGKEGLLVYSRVIHLVYFNSFYFPMKSCCIDYCNSTVYFSDSFLTKFKIFTNLACTVEKSFCQAFNENKPFSNKKIEGKREKKSTMGSVESGEE